MSKILFVAKNSLLAFLLIISISPISYPGTSSVQAIDCSKTILDDSSLNDLEKIETAKDSKSLEIDINNLKSIKECSLNDLQNLEELTIISQKKSDCCRFPDYIFSNCKNLKSLCINGTNLCFEENIFNYCSHLEAVQINGNNISLGNNPFYKCESLNNIEINGKNLSFGLNSFRECKKLAYVQVSGFNIKFNDMPFYDCKGLDSLKIDGNNIEFGYNSICNSSNLKELEIKGTSIIFRDGLSTRTYPKLKYISVKGDPKSVSNLNYFQGLESVQELIINSSKEYNLNPDLFINCHNINTVSCVKGSFSDNPNLYPANTSITYLDNSTLGSIFGESTPFALLIIGIIIALIVFALIVLIRVTAIKKI